MASQELGQPSAVGVDGCRNQWLGVWRVAEGLMCKCYASAEALLQAHPAPTIVVVDIPIGLTIDGPRWADGEARRFIPPRSASSVFSAPRRRYLNANSWEEVQRIRQKSGDKGLSKQAAAILPKIREWDELLRADAGAVERVYEVHPEVCFAAMRGGSDHGIRPSKKSPEGRKLRIQTLIERFGAEPVERLISQKRPAGAQLDDLLDALAALWTAERIVKNQASTIPCPIERDTFGLPMAIWY